MRIDAAHRRTTALVLALICALAAATACGGSDGDATATSTRSAATASPASTTAPATATAPAETPALTQPAAEPTRPAAATNTPGAQPTQPPPTQPPPPPPPPEQIFTVVARDIAFVPSGFTAAADHVITVSLDNQDAGVMHDMVIFSPSGDEVARTDLILGPGSGSASFRPAAPGRYAFKCSVHPQQMTGGITVR